MSLRRRAPRREVLPDVIKGILHRPNGQGGWLCPPLPGLSLDRRSGQCAVWPAGTGTGRAVPDAVGVAVARAVPPVTGRPPVGVYMAWSKVVPVGAFATGTIGKARP